MLTEKHDRAQRGPYKSVDLFGSNHHGAVLARHEHNTMTSSQTKMTLGVTASAVSRQCEKGSPFPKKIKSIIMYFIFSYVDLGFATNP